MSVLHQSGLSVPLENFLRILRAMRELKWKMFGCLGLMLLLLLWSAIEPKDRFTWLLEVLPVLVGIPILWFTAASFPLTPLTYGLLTIHAVILMVGGHYTYAEVPLGFWM